MMLSPQYEAAYKMIRHQVVSGVCDLETAKAHLKTQADIEAMSQQTRFETDVCKASHAPDRELDRLRREEVAIFGSPLSHEDED